jgi:membrane protein implicated in regulation of membrane protease activity
MTQKIKKKSVIAKKSIVPAFNIYWDKKNYLFLFLGFALLIVGYYVMSLGSWDSTESLIMSPIILVVAYVLIFPLSIFSKKKEITDKSKEVKN